MLTKSIYHDRRNHIRRNKTGKISNVKQTLVKTPQRPLRSCPLLPSGDILSLAAENSDSGNPDGVMFAFQCPDWAAKKFTRETREPWAQCGFTPEHSAQWRDAGYDAQEADRWRGYGDRTPIPVAEAIEYMKHDVDPTIAAIYFGTEFTIEESAAWGKSGTHFSDARTWKNIGVKTPQEAQPYIDLGFTDPYDVVLLGQMGQKRAHKWLEAGVRLKSVRSYEFLLNQGHSEKRIGQIIGKKDTGDPDRKIAWIKSNVPVSQISQFIKKGYTPSKAVSK
jgi:hypothetical protein